MSVEILRVLRSVAEGDEYARLYKWVSKDALYIEKRLRELIAVEQSMHLTAYRLWLAVSLLFNIILLAVALVVIGGR